MVTTRPVDPVDALLREILAPPPEQLAGVVLRFEGGRTWRLQPGCDLRTEAGHRIDLEELPLWIRAHPDGWFVARMRWVEEAGEQWLGAGPPTGGVCEVDFSCAAVITITRLYHEEDG